MTSAHIHDHHDHAHGHHDHAHVASTSSIDVDAIDVVVIGGGPAGLSAALALGRSRRSVVVVDAGRPRNRVSPHMHGVLGFDGRPPADYLAAGRSDLAAYDVTFVSATATSAGRADEGGVFEVGLDDGSTLRTRRVLVASGLTDELPAIDGVRERWGNDVLHCPYCHGWEVRDQAIAVISSGPMGVHQALMFRQWSPDVTLFTHSGPALTFGDEMKLTARAIPTIAGQVADIVVVDDRIVGVRMDSGDVHDAQAVVVGPRMVAHSPILDSFGLEAVAGPMGPEFGLAYEVSPTGETAAAGVWATGNVVDIAGTVSAVVGAGYKTGAMINADLIEEETAAAIATIGTSPDAPIFDEAFWDRRYGSADQIWSGRPNPQLVADLADLSPGRALDVGAGEGADAIWLAERGWKVTALDISSVALERGRCQVESLGAGLADRIEWVRTDVLETDLPEGPFDLVTLQFMQFGLEARTALFRRCIDAVAPGGTLQIVAHHPLDMDSPVGRPKMPDFFYTADEIADLLDDDWTVDACDARPRTMPGHDGHDGHDGADVTICDAVLLATRHPA